MKRVCADHEPLIITRNGAGQRTACQLGVAQSRFCHASSGRRILTYQVEFVRSAAKTHIRLDQLQLVLTVKTCQRGLERQRLRGSPLPCGRHSARMHRQRADRIEGCQRSHRQIP